MERKSKKPERVDHWLKARYPSLSKRQVEEALDSGLVCALDGSRVKKGLRLEDPVLDLTRLDAQLERLRQGKKIPIKVVEETGDWWVINKPPGIPSHPLSLYDEATVTHWAFQRDGRVKREFPEIQPTVAPHRLDTGTGGLLIVAKNRRGYEAWRERFSEKTVTKIYHAWVWGDPGKSREWQVDTPIGHDTQDHRKMVAGGGDKALPAQSFVEVSDESLGIGYFQVKVNCTTGVTHQVRVHLKSLGFPLLGDRLYDEDHQKREIHPEFHLLRASEIRCGKLWYRLREPFRIPWADIRKFNGTPEVLP